MALYAISLDVGRFDPCFLMLDGNLAQKPIPSPQAGVHAFCCHLLSCAHHDVPLRWSYAETDLIAS